MKLGHTAETRKVNPVFIVAYHPQEPPLAHDRVKCQTYTRLLVFAEQTDWLLLPAYH